MRACILCIVVLGCGPTPRSHGGDDTSGDGGTWPDSAPVGSCSEAEANKSYVGCEYWAVDLDNAVEVVGIQGSQACQLTPGATVSTQRVCMSSNNQLVAGQCDPPNETCPGGYACKPWSVCTLDAQRSPFAIVVSNPQDKPVDVTVTGPGGQTMTVNLAAGAVQAIKPQQYGMPDASVDGTIKTRAAYRVTSTFPIVAYQFNPLDNVNVFSNDASLLIPRTAFDTSYYAMSWPTANRRPQNHAYRGYVAVVAWKDGTQIEVTPTAAIEAGATQPAIAANTPTTFTLNAFDVLELQAGASLADLTGTKITGTSTFGVFAGHEAMGYGSAPPPDNIHTAGPCCADHIEEMMFPTSTWGKSFAVARSQRRNNEPDVIRIVAQKPNTTVTFSPNPIGYCPTLAPGQFCQVPIAVDTEITASEPILVGHYLESALWQNPSTAAAVGNGDPSMALAVPVEQFRVDYTILVPSAYQQNYLSIATPGGTVLVDGNPVTTTPFGNHHAARVMIGPGQHRIQCPQRCGVEVYGYSDAVSYLFAGGLDLKAIVIL